MLPTHGTDFNMTVRGIIYLAQHRNLLHQTQALRRNVVFALQNMCEACPLYTGVAMQALRCVVEFATPEK